MREFTHKSLRTCLSQDFEEFPLLVYLKTSGRVAYTQYTSITNIYMREFTSLRTCLNQDFEEFPLLVYLKISGRVA